MDEAITSKIVTAQSIETKLLEQQTRQVLADKAVLVISMEKVHPRSWADLVLPGS